MTTKPAANTKPRTQPAKAKAAPSPKRTPKAQPAPKAAAVAPKAAAPRPALLALGREFVAKVGGKYAQAENWAVTQKATPCAREDLIAALNAAAAKGGYADRCNAAGFVQGRIRGGNLV